MEDVHRSEFRAVVRSNDKLAESIFSLWIEAGPIAKTARPGQFLSVYMDDRAHLLPRPLSLCDIDPQKGLVRLVFRVAGEGTKAFSLCRPGDELRVLGPLGNGYPTDTDSKALIVGGGIGIPPMLALSRSLSCEKDIVLGYKDELFLRSDFEACGPVYVATEDGSSGVRGTVLDSIRENGLKADVVFACGPRPMLKALKDYTDEHGMECYISMEERMACGIGACLGCVCDSVDVDEQTNVHRKRVCRDGPVFRAGEVVL